MKGEPEERAVQVGRYIVQNRATVRAAAKVFGVSKSTVWKDQCRLQRIEPGLWREVRQVLLRNKAERHLRGGEATRCRYLLLQSRACAGHTARRSAGVCSNVPGSGRLRRGGLHPVSVPCADKQETVGLTVPADSDQEAVDGIEPADGYGVGGIG